MKNIVLLISSLLVFSFVSCKKQAHVSIYSDANSPVISYGIKRLEKQLVYSAYQVSTNSGKGKADRVIVISIDSDQPDEEYHLVQVKDTVYISGATERSCLYGIMDLMEQLGPECNFGQVEDHSVKPAFAFRAIKFNLPWAPYRPGPATDLHRQTCRDLEFWEAFLDMMVENRFNALTLWSKHLFPYMIRAKNFPEATPFDEHELSEWKEFWESLFKMAGERGIETYLLNWNIVVSPEFASAYGVGEHNDRSELVKRYTRESVTQLIDEYPGLTGLGVTLADWMGNWGDELMTPLEREEWIDETFVEGMNAAGRKIKFIHRAVLAGDPAEMRRVIDHAGLPEKTIVEVKFNWSHAHSSPRLSLTHSNDEGTIMRGFWDPEPENFFIAWMMRNEDFFVLRWGNPDFIREHIQINSHPYVDGYFVGSEGYIPAADYSHKEHPHKTWNYAFEKQWMFYHLWGRLTYNPEETDEVLARALRNRYPDTNEKKLMEAYSLASTVPLRLAAFYKSTWDFTLYSEGFLAPWTTGYDDGKSPFISLEELIRHETLDAGLMGIKEYCEAQVKGIPDPADRISPLALADLLGSDCSRALGLIDEIREAEQDPTLESELADLETWCHLGTYFADKLRAGVALETFRLSGDYDQKEQARIHLDQCLAHWDNVIRITEERYKPMPYVSMGHPDQLWPEFKAFHWSLFRDQVEADLEYAMKQTPWSRDK